MRLSAQLIKHPVLRNLAPDPYTGPITLTLRGSSLYSCSMEGQKNELEELELKQLEARVEELIKTCATLKDENNSLRQHQDNLISERARLIEKTEVARTRVEAMINRLKAMETHHE